MKMIQRLSSLLGFPSCYQLFQHLVGQDFAYKTYIGEYVKPAAGDKSHGGAALQQAWKRAPKVVAARSSARQTYSPNTA